MRGAAQAVLDRRLDPASSAPIAVAVSGGADSLLALKETVVWARANGRPVLALSVDHRLQAASAAWITFVGDYAARLGAGFRPLAWEGPKPDTGLPAAARAARHRLLADAARAAGASVLVFGHTASDAAENAALGQGVLTEWTPSPVWPQGRELFILRPLLHLGRDDVRRNLASDGETWIDDPANDDLRHPRVRARMAGPAAKLASAPPLIADLARHVHAEHSAFRLDRNSLRNADPLSARRLLAVALTSAGGGERPARGDHVDTLLSRLRAAGSFQATLAGARCIGGEEDINVVRDAGERRRARLGSLDLAPGRPVAWDGRYEVEARVAGLSIDILRGHAARLPAAERRVLANLPAEIRPTLPVILGPDGPSCPTLAPLGGLVSLRELTQRRFLGACGAIAQESELAQGAHGASGAGILCSSPVMK